MVPETDVGQYFLQYSKMPHLGPIFRTFFPGKISGKIPRKIFPQKMLGKIIIFRGKSFEKSFFQKIPRNFPRKITFHGKKCTENRPQLLCVILIAALMATKKYFLQYVHMSKMGKSQFGHF
jgi:hypothetical protein